MHLTNFKFLALTINIRTSIFFTKKVAVKIPWMQWENRKIDDTLSEQKPSAEFETVNSWNVRKAQRLCLQFIHLCCQDLPPFYTWTFWGFLREFRQGFLKKSLDKRMIKKIIANKVVELSAHFKNWPFQKQYWAWAHSKCHQFSYFLIALKKWGPQYFKSWIYVFNGVARMTFWIC